MSMNVIDVASYQKSLNLNNVNYDGVAIKATEGNSYTNPYCDMHYQEAKAAGKKRAVYHFYDFSVDAVTQANYFVDNCQGYVRDAIFVLDWEGSGVADVGAALRFLQQVESRTGVKPAIYMSEWVENNYDWSAVVANDNGLWIAKYSNWEINNHASDFDMSNAGQAPALKHWSFYFMWQWTSTGLLNGYAGNLDCDIAYLSGDQWDAYAGVQATTTTTTTEAPVAEPSTTTTTTTAVEQTAPLTATTTTTEAVAPVAVVSSVSPTVSLTEAVLARAVNTFWQTFLAIFVPTIAGLTSGLLSVHSLSDLKAFALSTALAVVAAALSALKNVLQPPKEVTK